MLRLVHPAPAGNEGPRPPRRWGTRAPSLSLTPEEARHLRAAIRNVARTLGSKSALARLLGVSRDVLTKRSLPHPGLAIAVARIAGLSVDAMLCGKLTAAGICPRCGAKPDDVVPDAGGAT